MFQGVKEIRDAYRHDTIAQGYIGERFQQPLGRLLHERQVAALTSVIRRERPRRILELAPGPARLTCAVARQFDGAGFMADASMQMLHEARKRLGGFSGWHATQSDAFSLPFRRPFDMVYSFRLIRHFELGERAALYRQMASVLRPGGVLVFDAVNAVVSQPLRERAAPGEYQHYDALLTRAQLEQEVGDAGLRVESLVGVQHAFPALMRVQVLVAPRSQRLAHMLIAAIDRVGLGEPLEWVVVCRRA